MTKHKVILATGLLLAASTVIAQTPTVTVKGAGARADATGAIQFVVNPNGVKIAGLVFELEFPADQAASIALGTHSAADVPVGFDSPSVASATPGRIVYTTITGDGMGLDTNPLVFKLNLTNRLAAGLKGIKFNVVGYDESTFSGSNFADENLNTLPIPGMTVSLVNGASRDLGGAMNNSVSVAPGVIAAAAGSSFWLLNSATNNLAPATGWETAKPLDGPVSGRPAFGTIDGALAVAVGTDAGTLSVFDVATGAAAGSYKGDFVTIPTAPAIGGNNNVYVAGTTADGVQVARVIVTGGTAALGEAFSVAGSTQVQSSPAVGGNALVVGTNNTVFRASVDAAGVLTPQVATGADGVAFNTSPVVSGAYAFVGDATGVVHKILLATGAVEGTSAAIAAPLSDPFAQGGNVHFGGGDGNVYTFAAGDVSVAPATTAVGSTPVVQPVDTGSLVVAATQGGTVMAGAESVDLGPGIGKAVSYLRDPATVVVNKIDGTVYAIPTS